MNIVIPKSGADIFLLPNSAVLNTVRSNNRRATFVQSISRSELEIDPGCIGTLGASGRRVRHRAGKKRSLDLGETPQPTIRSEPDRSNQRICCGSLDPRSGAGSDNHRRGRYKGFDEVIEAMPELLRRFPNLKYMIIGDGDNRGSLEEKVKSLGLSEQMIFAGKFQNRRGVWFRVLEALARGVPVICGKGGWIA
jgi:glycosyltransferase involved in cell wall biosynthesis